MTLVKCLYCDAENDALIAYAKREGPNAVMCVVNRDWWIEAAYPDPVGFYWLLDLAAVAAIGGIWTWCFIRQLGRASLLPTGDPYLPDYLPEVTT